MIDFTSEDIHEAFQVTGIIPSPGTWLEVMTDGTYRGGLLIALAVHRSRQSPGKWLADRKPTASVFLAKSELKLTWGEVFSLEDGFNGNTNGWFDSPEAFRIGAKTRLLIKPERNVG